MGLMQRVISDTTTPPTSAADRPPVEHGSLLQRAASLHSEAQAAIDSLLQGTRLSAPEQEAVHSLPTSLQQSQYGSLSAFHVLDALVHSLQVDMAAILILDRAAELYIPAALTGFDATTAQRFQLPQATLDAFLTNSSITVPRSEAEELRQLCSTGLWYSAQAFVFARIHVPSTDNPAAQATQAVITVVDTSTHRESLPSLARLLEVFCPLAATVLFNREVMAKLAIPKPVIYYDREELISRNPQLLVAYDITYLITALAERVPFTSQEALRQDIIDSAARLLSRIAIIATVPGSSKIHIGVMTPGIDEPMLLAALQHGLSRLYPEAKSAIPAI